MAHRYTVRKVIIKCSMSISENVFFCFQGKPTIATFSIAACPTERMLIFTYHMDDLFAKMNQILTY